MGGNREPKHEPSRREGGDTTGATPPGRKISVLLAAMLLAIFVVACRQASRQPQDKSQSAANSPGPMIEAAPIEPSQGQWKIATSDTITLTVTAPGAEKVKFLYQPVIATGRHIELKSGAAPTDRPHGKFLTEFKAQPDFAGSVWAEVSYPDGTKKLTEPLALTTETAISSQEGQVPLDRMGGSIGMDESARSDKITGGRIEKTLLVIHLLIADGGYSGGSSDSRQRSIH